jgi:hypothetical protein
VSGEDDFVSEGAGGLENQPGEREVVAADVAQRLV